VGWKTWEANEANGISREQMIQEKNKQFLVMK